jgi:hypothetical protein
MHPNDSTDLNVTTLLALRQETDAIRVITERLKVKEMGPADHIRTKHEAKAFVELGDVRMAEDLLKRASERRALSQTQTQEMTHRQGQRI